MCPWNEQFEMLFQHVVFSFIVVVKFKEPAGSWKHKLQATSGT